MTEFVTKVAQMGGGTIWAILKNNKTSVKAARATFWKLLDTVVLLFNSISGHTVALILQIEITPFYFNRRSSEIFD